MAFAIEDPICSKYEMQTSNVLLMASKKNEMLTSK